MHIKLELMNTKTYDSLFFTFAQREKESMCGSQNAKFKKTKH